MEGLRLEIADGIKPKMLKEAISSTRIRDNQLSCQEKVTRPSFTPTSSSSIVNRKPTPPMTRLSWDEMQKGRTKGLF